MGRPGFAPPTPLSMKTCMSKVLSLASLLSATACSSPAPEVFNPCANADLPLLRREIRQICGDRWDLQIGADGVLVLNTRMELHGSAPAYNFPPGDHMYTLLMRFRIVPALPAGEAYRRRETLGTLRLQAQGIPQDSANGYTLRYGYTPRNDDEAALVAKVEDAARLVGDIPEFRYRSVYLSEEDSMTFFQPHPSDAQAVQCKADMVNLYKALKPVPREERVRPWLEQP